MLVLYSPQVNHESLEYIFEGDKITVLYNGDEDIYDFTDMPNGYATSHGRNPTIVSSLSITPVTEARKENGVLKVTLLKFISEDASEEDKFPDWIEV